MYLRQIRDTIVSHRLDMYQVFSEYSKERSPGGQNMLQTKEAFFEFVKRFCPQIKQNVVTSMFLKLDRRQQGTISYADFSPGLADAEDGN